MAEERLAAPQPCWKLHFVQPRLLLQSEEIRCWPQDARVAAGQVTKRTADPDHPARENELASQPSRPRWFDRPFQDQQDFQNHTLSP